MPKNDLIAIIAGETGATPTHVKAVIESLTSRITDALKGGGTFNLLSIGKFEAVQRPERKGVHPRTGEAMMLKASTAAKFRPAKALKDALN